MVGKHFLTTAILCNAILLLGADANLFGGGRAGSGSGYSGGGGYAGGGAYSGGGYSGGGYGMGSSYGVGSGYGRGLGTGGFYGGGLFYGDYITGGGYPGYFAPYAYPNRAPSYFYLNPLAPYHAPRISSYSTGGATSYYSAPSGPTNPASTLAPATGRAIIRVLLPDPQATVVFDGKATISTGTERLFRTPELTPGESYHYKLRVTWMQDGNKISEERTVGVIAGRTTQVAFPYVPSEAVSVAK